MQYQDTESRIEEELEKKDMQSFSLSILAPERRLIEGETVVSLIVTTSEGEIEVLPGHANMVALLETGRFSYTPRGAKPVTGVISSGFLNVEANSVKVVAETIELVGEIDANRARQAQVDAQKMLNDSSLDEKSFKKYQLKLQRAIIRQNIGSNSH